MIFKNSHRWVLSTIFLAQRQGCEGVVAQACGGKVIDRVANPSRPVARQKLARYMSLKKTSVSDIVAVLHTYMKLYERYT